MRAFTSIPYISKARILVLTHGLLPEQFGATVAWPGDRLNFEAGVGPAGTPGDEDGAQEDDGMDDVMIFFL